MTEAYALTMCMKPVCHCCFNIFTGQRINCYLTSRKHLI